MPTWTPIDVVPGSKNGEPTDCPERFAFCVVPDEARSLFTQLSDLVRWIVDVNTLCGEQLK